MTDEIIDELDRMERMNIDTAQGMLSEAEEPESYTAADGETTVTAMQAGDRVIALASRPEQPGLAWSSHQADFKIIDDLYNNGVLVDGE